MHVCMHACMHACDACMHVCMYVCMCVCLHVCVHACMHTYIHVCACMYVCLHVCMNIKKKGHCWSIASSCWLQWPEECWQAELHCVLPRCCACKPLSHVGWCVEWGGMQIKLCAMGLEPPHSFDRRGLSTWPLFWWVEWSCACFSNAIQLTNKPYKKQTLTNNQ